MCANIRTVESFSFPPTAKGARRSKVLACTGMVIGSKVISAGPTGWRGRHSGAADLSMCCIHICIQTYAVAVGADSMYAAGISQALAASSRREYWGGGQATNTPNGTRGATTQSSTASAYRTSVRNHYQSTIYHVLQHSMYSGGGGPCGAPSVSSTHAMLTPPADASKPCHPGYLATWTGAPEKSFQVPARSRAGGSHERANERAAALCGS